MNKNVTLVDKRRLKVFSENNFYNKKFVTT